MKLLHLLAALALFELAIVRLRSLMRCRTRRHAVLEVDSIAFYAFDQIRNATLPIFRMLLALLGCLYAPGFTRSNSIDHASRVVDVVIIIIDVAIKRLACE
ncbi:hypothetical protein Xcaj_20635 [Xanthomonas axonopodis pv. cajani]|uniref:Secreted protein n=1 Tax=Xanthomonas axonopodis pv. cajani TaxID=487827 RepID=A0ABX3MGI5_9XANT|nr:hypothetical protein Xcaj_20635 [Xanthomonas axonopodis pv. cajani]